MSEENKYHELLKSDKAFQVVDLLLKDIKLFESSTTDTDIDIQKKYEQLIIVSSQIQSLQTKINLGILRDDDIRIEKNRIGVALLSLIDTLPDFFWEWIADYEQKEEEKRKAEEEIRLRHENACNILGVNRKTLTAHLVQKKYNALIIELSENAEKAPNALKARLNEEIEKVNEAFYLIYPKLKSKDDKRVGEAYITLESDNDCPLEQLIETYKNLKTGFNELLLSTNSTVKNLAKSEIEILNTALTTIIDVKFPDKITELKPLIAPAGMQLIEGGNIEMGISKKKRIIKDFFLDVLPVTVADYREYCESVGYSMPPEPFWGWHDSHPIVNVSWNEAMEYAKWVNKRLPDEWEWEYAAQGGSRKQDFLYAGSNNANDVAWYKENSGNQVQNAGTKLPNSLGLYDMSGNVWEWCSNWYTRGSFDNDNENNHKFKVLRGGAWISSINSLNITQQENAYPELRSISNGFRCAKDIE